MHLKQPLNINTSFYNLHKETSSLRCEGRIISFRSLNIKIIVWICKSCFIDSAENPDVGMKWRNVCCPHPVWNLWHQPAAESRTAAPTPEWVSEKLESTEDRSIPPPSWSWTGCCSLPAFLQLMQRETTQNSGLSSIIHLSCFSL